MRWTTEKLEEIGYSGSKVVLKSDQEPSMLSLKKAVAIARQGETCPIESPVRESKSNGAMERTIRTWQGQLRTLRSSLEAKLGVRLPAEHVLTEWMCLWTAEVLSIYIEYISAAGPHMSS